MAKISRAYYILLMTALIIFISTIPMQAVIGQKSHQVLTKINSKYLALSWGDIWKKLRRKKAPGSGRPGMKGFICAIAPRRLDESLSTKQVTQEINEIWSLRPLFLWYMQGGTAQRIELSLEGSEKPFWSRELKAGETRVIYDGKPLQPGQLYVWRLIAPYPRKQPPFKVMEQQKRDRITNELTQLEERLKKQGTSTEKIALEKADYFAQQEFWSDALREIYAVPNPSAELTEIIQQIPSLEYCSTAAANAALS